MIDQTPLFSVVTRFGLADHAKYTIHLGRPAHFPLSYIYSVDNHMYTSCCNVKDYNKFLNMHSGRNRGKLAQITIRQTKKQSTDRQSWNSSQAS